MHPVPLSDFVAALIASSLEAPAAQAPRAPLTCIPTSDLARASNFFQCTLGFEIRRRIPHLVAQIRWGDTLALLLQTGAAAGRCERAQHARDMAPVKPSTCRIATPQLHRLYHHMQSAQGRSSGPCALTPPVWEPWNAWECSCIDSDGNTLVFTQAATPACLDGLRSRQ